MSETNGSYFFPFTSSVWLDNKDIFYTGLTEDWRIFYNILLLNGWRYKRKKGCINSDLQAMQLVNLFNPILELSLSTEFTYQAC